tara:strand:- start:128839 stop:129147 length:309 start_codon:yes stop_codon:yes gene_type:complete
MKVLATLKNLDSDSCKNLIVRNLSRILDIRIIDVDVDNGVIGLVYNAQESFEQVKRELIRIGHPIQNYTSKFTTDSKFQKVSSQNASKFTMRGRKSYFSVNR